MPLNLEPIHYVIAEKGDECCVCGSLIDEGAAVTETEDGEVVCPACEGE